jgi:uncharacterized membrane protein YedE/YeeE
VKRAAGFAIGLVFGIVLCWSGMSSPEVIRQALLFEQSYLFLFMFSAIATATLGIRLLGKARAPVRERPQRRHVEGAVIFGIGWGVADACPGPVLTQVGQGIGWALFTFAGVVTGVYLFHRSSRFGTAAPSSVAHTRGVVPGSRYST